MLVIIVKQILFTSNVNLLLLLLLNNQFGLPYSVFCVPADTHCNWRRHVHGDVIGIYRWVQPRPLVWRLAVGIAFPFARLWNLTLVPPGYALRVLVLTVLQWSNNSVTEGPITLCAEQAVRTHLHCGELPQFYTVHAVSLCQFGSCACKRERTKSKTVTESGPTMLLGVIWIKQCLPGLHCTEKCRTWVWVSILRKELTNANISGRPGCQKSFQLCFILDRIFHYMTV